MNTIKCPFCNWEYLPVEIYIPNRIFGRPKNIIKSDSGEILHVNYDIKPDSDESYTCDHCNNTFNLQSDFNVYTKNINDNFSEDYIIKKEPKLELNEVLDRYD